MGLIRGRRLAAARAGVVALLVGGVAVTGCSDDETIDVPLVLEDFEDGCADALPCGWSRITGDADTVARVRTFHPGEHGLRLVGDGVGAVGAAGVDGLSGGGGFGGGPTLSFDVAVFPEPLGARAVGRCTDADDAVLVTLDATVGVAGPDAPPDPPATVTYAGRVTLSDRTADVGDTLLPIVTMPPTPPPAGAIVLSTETVRLTKDGPGTCEISLLAIGSVPDDLR